MVTTRELRIRAFDIIRLVRKSRARPFEQKSCESVGEDVVGGEVVGEEAVEWCRGGGRGREGMEWEVRRQGSGTGKGREGRWWEGRRWEGRWREGKRWEREEM